MPSCTESHSELHCAAAGLGERDVQFVKEMIFGPFQRGEAGAGGWPYRGRGPHQYFLYEIVANKISSVDVDK